MGLRAGLGLMKTFLSRYSKQTVRQVSQAPQRMTRVMTDSSTGIVKMEREITRNGQDALATLERMPDGTTKMTITGGDNPLWRTKTITRENGGGIWGGGKITIEKKDTKYWCHSVETKLTKEYNPKTGLEHKELTYHKNVGNETHINHKAVQDRVYDEYPLNNSASDMLKNPDESRYIKHSLDRRDNYHQFADGASTNYTRTVQAKEQAVIDAAKKAEAEALAAKEAAEKAAVELKAKQPRINISKALNRDINELAVKETKLADGTMERVFTDPESGKVLVKTQDLGSLHKEWIYGGKADMIYMKQVGNDAPYIVAKKGNYTQVDYVKSYDNWQNPDGSIRKEHISRQYYNDGQNYLERSIGGSKLYANNARGRVTVFDETAAKERERFSLDAKEYPDYPQIGIYNGVAWYNPNLGYLTNRQVKANEFVRELDANAQKNFINLEGLYKGF